VGVEVADAADAGASYDTGAFDVDIQYADRSLPDVSAPPEGGATEAGAGLPNCPPWIPVDMHGNPVDIMDPSIATLIPSDYAADGGVVPAVPGGACATYPWYPFPEPGFVEWWAMNNGKPLVPLPPCNWALDAGVAQAGTQAGQSRYELCMQLYTCIQNTGCWSGALNNACLCDSSDAGATCRQGGAPPNGPCAAQEVAGFEVTADTKSPTTYILLNFLDPNRVGPGSPPYINASLLNYVYGLMRNRQNVAQVNALQAAAVQDAGQD
jgi:hypothetical protein